MPKEHYALELALISYFCNIPDKMVYGIDGFINSMLDLDFCASNYLMVCADTEHCFSCCPWSLGWGICARAVVFAPSQTVRAVRKIWNPMTMDSLSCLDCKLRRCMYRNFQMYIWMSFCRNVLKWPFSTKSCCSPMNFKSVFHNIKMLKLLRKQQ